MEDTDIPDDLVEVLNDFQRTADQIVNSLRKCVEARKPPRLIYHYTNDIGLKGIIESGQLWLSDIFSLNDPSELSHGLSHAVKILNSKAESGLAETKIFANNFANFCQDGVRESAHYFTCSFSSDSDDLGQWRAYADNGHGYALGFDEEALVNAFNGEIVSYERDISTFQMTYDDHELIGIHQQLIESMFSLISLPRIKSHGNTQTNNYLGYLSVLLSLYTLSTALYFKHKAYKNESEFRLLQMFRGDIPAPDVKWRHRSYELVKYREFSWRDQQPGILKHIVVGPAADQHKATRFANDCLKAFHTEDVEITCSEIPYRVV